MIDPYYGVRAETYKETDYQLGTDIGIDPAPHTFEECQIEYNQKLVANNSCTIHGAITALSNLMDYEFSTKEIKGIWQLALDEGASEEWGWYSNEAVDLVRHYWNQKHPNKPVYSFITRFGGDKYNEMLNLGYMAVISHRGNAKYNEDKLDSILDGTDFGATTYGHCLSSDEYNEKLRLIVNNYKDLYVGYNNRYKVPIENIPALIDNNVFFRNAYFFVTNYKDMNDTVPIWAKESVQRAIDNDIAKIWTKEQQDKIVGDSVLEEILFNMGALTKKEGEVSKLRLIVAFDRMGLLDKKD